MENEIVGPIEEKSSSVKPKKKAGKIIRAIVAVILICILAFFVWVAVAWFQKVPSRSVIPPDYSIFLHSDSAYQTFDPLLDLKAMEVFLSLPELRGTGELVRQLKDSKLRESSLFKKLTSRKTDLAFYSEDDGLFNFLAVMDMGPYAFLSRMSPLFINRLKENGIKDIEYVEDDSFLPYYQIKNGESCIYFKPYKNLIIASSSMKLFTRALLNSPFSDAYTEEEKLAFPSEDFSVRLIAKPRILFRSLTSSNVFTREIDALLASSLPASLSISLDDSSVRVSMSLPLDLSGKESPLLSLLAQDSSLPSFAADVKSTVTSSTLLNIAELSDLKDAVFPLFTDTIKLDELWSSTQYMSRILLGITLDDILFSWTGKEVAVLGVRDYPGSVFAVEVSDEEEREKVFKKLSSSLFVRKDSSMVVDGVRLDQLTLPPLVSKLLSSIKVSLPAPFYYIQDGFIYFSQSPEALARLYNSGDAGRMPDNYEDPSSISVSYNLESKTPFFLEGDTAFVKALSYYKKGHCDIAVDGDSIKISLNAKK